MLNLSEAQNYVNGRAQMFRPRDSLGRFVGGAQPKQSKYDETVELQQIKSTLLRLEKLMGKQVTTATLNKAGLSPLGPLNTPANGNARAKQTAKEDKDIADKKRDFIANERRERREIDKVRLEKREVIDLRKNRKEVHKDFQEVDKRLDQIIKLLNNANGTSILSTVENLLKDVVEGYLLKKFFDMFNKNKPTKEATKPTKAEPKEKPTKTEPNEKPSKKTTTPEERTKGAKPQKGGIGENLKTWMASKGFLGNKAKAEAEAKIAGEVAEKAELDRLAREKTALEARTEANNKLAEVAELDIKASKEAIELAKARETEITKEQEANKAREQAKTSGLKEDNAALEAKERELDKARADRKALELKAADSKIQAEKAKADTARAELAAAEQEARVAKDKQNKVEADAKAQLEASKKPPTEPVKPVEEPHVPTKGLTSEEHVGGVGGGKVAAVAAAATIALTALGLAKEQSKVDDERINGALSEEQALAKKQKNQAETISGLINDVSAWQAIEMGLAVAMGAVGTVAAAPAVGIGGVSAAVIGGGVIAAGMAYDVVAPSLGLPTITGPITKGFEGIKGLLGKGDNSDKPKEGEVTTAVPATTGTQAAPSAPAAPVSAIPVAEPTLVSSTTPGTSSKDNKATTPSLWDNISGFFVSEAHADTLPPDFDPKALTAGSTPSKEDISLFNYYSDGIKQLEVSKIIKENGLIDSWSLETCLIKVEQIKEIINQLNEILTYFDSRVDGDSQSLAKRTDKLIYAFKARLESIKKRIEDLKKSSEATATITAAAAKVIDTVVTVGSQAAPAITTPAVISTPTAESKPSSILTRGLSSAGASLAAGATAVGDFIMPSANANEIGAVPPVPMAGNAPSSTPPTAQPAIDRAIGVNPSVADQIPSSKQPVAATPSQPPPPPPREQPPTAGGNEGSLSASLSSTLITNVKKLEGFTAVAAADYKQLSNGYGTKSRYPGEEIDKTEAEKRLKEELAKAKYSVSHAVNISGLPIGVVDALTSMTFNLGPGAMSQLYQTANECASTGDYKPLADRMQLYNKAGGTINGGLVKRRKEEASWFMGAGYDPGTSESVMTSLGKGVHSAAAGVGSAIGTAVGAVGDYMSPIFSSMLSGAKDFTLAALGDNAVKAMTDMGMKIETGRKDYNAPLDKWAASGQKRQSAGGAGGRSRMPASVGMDSFNAPSEASAVSGGGSGRTISMGGNGIGDGTPPDNIPLTEIKTKSGKTAKVNSAYAPNFQGFINDLEATGYQITDLGGYSPRKNANNSSRWSTHAWGAAIDINPDQSPNRSKTTDLPPSTAELAAKWGLGWGMNWKSVQDPMHFSSASREGGSEASVAKGPGTQPPTMTAGSNQPATMPTPQITSPGNISSPVAAPASPPATSPPTSIIPKNPVQPVPPVATPSPSTPTPAATTAKPSGHTGTITTVAPASQSSNTPTAGGPASIPAPLTDKQIAKQKFDAIGKDTTAKLEALTAKGAGILEAAKEGKISMADAHKQMDSISAQHAAIEKGAKEQQSAIVRDFTSKHPEATPAPSTPPTSSAPAVTTGSSRGLSSGAPSAPAATTPTGSVTGTPISRSTGLPMHVDDKGSLTSAPTATPAPAGKSLGDLSKTAAQNRADNNAAAKAKSEATQAPATSPASTAAGSPSLQAQDAATKQSFQAAFDKAPKTEAGKAAEAQQAEGLKQELAKAQAAKAPEAQAQAQQNATEAQMTPEQRSAAGLRPSFGKAKPAAGTSTPTPPTSQPRDTLQEKAPPPPAPPPPAPKVVPPAPSPSVGPTVDPKDINFHPSDADHNTPQQHS